MNPAQLLLAFRHRHPLGGVSTELLRVEEGLYIVRAQVLVDKSPLGCGLGQGESVELAEDRALYRALNNAGFSAETAPAPKMVAPPERNGNAPTPVIATNGHPPAYSAPVAYDEPEEEETDVLDLIAETDVLLKRVGWGPQQGKDYLNRTYGKSARRQLNEEELRDFLRYLKTLPARRAPAPEAPF
jgi:hypothetical protein